MLYFLTLLGDQERGLSSSGRLKVALANGDYIPADHVIVTVSLGVLKEHHHDLFQPCLSKEKQSVIDRLGFGTVDNISLQCDSQFWRKSNKDFIRLMWRDEWKYAVKKNPSQVNYILRISVVFLRGKGSIYGENYRLKSKITDPQYGTLLHSYCIGTYTEVVVLPLWSNSTITLEYPCKYSNRVAVYVLHGNSRKDTAENVQMCFSLSLYLHRPHGHHAF